MLEKKFMTSGPGLKTFQMIQTVISVCIFPTQYFSPFFRRISVKEIHMRLCPSIKPVLNGIDTKQKYWRGIQSIIPAK